MNKPIYLFIVLITLFSCSSVKYKYLDTDAVKDFKNVKSVSVKSIRLYTKIPDTSKIDMFFNHKNQLIKQIDYYGNYYSAYYMSYDKKGLLVKTISKHNDSIETGFIENEYDNKKNLLRITSYVGGKIISGKRYEYDKNNYKIKEFTERHGKIIDAFNLRHNFKERSVEIINLDSTKRKSYDFKMYYNKKGYLIKTAQINKSGDLVSKSKYTYDENGILKRHEVFKNERLIRVKNYETFYDSEGNVIERILYEDEKAVRKSLFYLTYY